MVFENILVSEFAVRIIYPFLLIFTLVFAILQKSKILGEDKKQIDALISLSIALIVIAFSWATNIIVNLMPFLAVSIVILLVFMVLYGFVASGKEGFEISGKLKVGIGVLAFIAVVIAVLIVTGQWERVYHSLFIEYGSGTNVLTNLILLVIVIGAIVAVVFPFGKTKKD